MANQYLKCNYYENAPMMTFSNEYLITFKIKGNKVNPSVLLKSKEGDVEFPARDREWCIIPKRDFYVDENIKNSGRIKINGLVKLVKLRFNPKKDIAIVGINNVPDRQISYFHVPMEEIFIK